MRKCPLCKESKPEDEFMGLYCSWCDKWIGDVQAELAGELNG